MELRRISYDELTSKQKEIYNFQKVAGILADFGFNCIKLNDDWQGADCGVPVASADGPLYPFEFVAMTRTVYSVPSVSPVRVSAYLSPAEVDCSPTMLVAGSLEICLVESNSSRPDFHWILNAVVVAASDEDQRT